jgi:hypothetical protein
MTIKGYETCIATLAGNGYKLALLTEDDVLEAKTVIGFLVYETLGAQEDKTHCVFPVTAFGVHTSNDENYVLIDPDGQFEDPQGGTTWESLEQYKRYINQ